MDANEHWNCNGAWQCPSCHSALRYEKAPAALCCTACATRLPIDDDILIVKDQTSDNNQVAQGFYDSPLWPKFRFWEWFTWLCNGGERRARNRVLRHLPTTPGLHLLDVADRRRRLSRLAAARLADRGRRHLALAAQRLPSPRRRPPGLAGPVRSRGPAAREPPVRRRLEHRRLQLLQRPRRRPARNGPRRAPGAPIVVSDELPNLTDRMLGHKLGIPGVDRWVVSHLMHLGDSFTDMVERHRNLDVQAIAGRVLGDFKFEKVWHGVGYVLVGRAPA